MGKGVQREKVTGSSGTVEPQLSLLRRNLSVAPVTTKEVSYHMVRREYVSEEPS